MHVVALGPSERGGLPVRSLRVEPQQVLCAALLILCVSNLVRMPVAETGVHTAPIILNDIFAVVAIIVGGLAMLRKRSLKLDDVTFAALVFAAFGGLSTLAAVPRFGLSFFEVMLSLGYLARWLLYLGLYVTVINTVRSEDGGTRKVFAALETAILLMAAFGIFQSIFLPNFAQRLYPDSRLYFDHDPQGHRLVSTILDPNLCAAMILVVLLVQLAQLSEGARVAWWKPALLFVSLVLTLSRGGALSFVVGGLVILIVRGLSTRLLKFAALGLVAIGALLPRIVTLGANYRRFEITDASAASRVLGWTRAIGTFLDYPWIGIGFNTYGFVQERRGISAVGTASYSVEGGLLFIAVMTGVVGVGLYCVMLWRVLRRCRRTWKMPSSTPDERGFVVGAAAVTIAMVIDSLFVNSLLTPSIMEPLWVLWGLAFVSSVAARRRAAQTA